MSTSLAVSSFTPEQGRLYAEAKRIARRDGITNPETFTILFQSLCYEEWRRVIEPWFKLKADVIGARIPSKMWFTGDGPMQVEYEPISPELQQALDQVDEAIKSEARRYGLQLPSDQL